MSIAWIGWFIWAGDATQHTYKVYMILQQSTLLIILVTEHDLLFLHGTHSLPQSWYKTTGSGSAVSRSHSLSWPWHKPIYMYELRRCTSTKTLVILHSTPNHDGDLLFIQGLLCVFNLGLSISASDVWILLCRIDSTTSDDWCSPMMHAV